MFSNYENFCSNVKEIPKSSLGYNTNNKYPEFPPLMDDGRAVTTSYQPESVINQHIIHKNNIQSNWQYRKYLTENAEKIMQDNFRDSCNDCGYYIRHNDLPLTGIDQVKDNRTPFLYNSFYDNQKPFGYASSDLKDLYLSREQLESRKFSPAITQEEILKQQQQQQQR